METCVIETGLLRKKECGHPAQTKCANCERPLCAQHAVAQLSAAGKKTGTYMCKECDDARREIDKEEARAAKQQEQKKAAELMKSLTQGPPPKPKAAPGGAPAGAPPQPGAAAAPPKDEGALEFTPTPKKDDGSLDLTPDEKKK